MERRTVVLRFKAPKDKGKLKRNVRHLVPVDTPRLADIMRDYHAVQPEVFEGTINKYAHDMTNENFNWEKIDPKLRIVLDPDGKTIKEGHHRFIAAHIAAEATGRRVIGGPNPIIPKEGFGPPEKPQGSLQQFKIRVSKGFK